jgi:excinuclease ABC subunit A
VQWLVVRGARHNNLKKFDAHIPLGRFVCVTGVSGSGKSSLVNDILWESLREKLNEAETAQPGAHDEITGVEHLDRVIDIDQSPIGRTPRSNPATYVKVFDEIRDLFAKLPDSKVRGYAPGRFSFNVATGEGGGGRCEACEGNGANRVEMDFLADVWVTCPVCQGRRFNHETLQILYKGKSIYDVLEMDVQEALTHFEAIPKIRVMLQTLHDVGLDYIKLGQSSTTLSGGEAQRIKLARELARPASLKTLYILDEPTTGLHFEDIRRLLAVLHGFVDAGHSVLVIEHNLDVVKTADWVIDLGPEGGEAGGRIVVAGTPEEVAACRKSYTGQSLADVLRPTLRQSARRSQSAFRNPQSAIAAKENRISVVGAREHNLKDVTVSFPRGEMTVCSGLSGSGKSSFAMDTVYAEGQRRYVESLSAYARQFLGQMQKPKVDHVHGLSPAIAIEQQTTTKSPRSTVGTVTEIYDYMRVLWARLASPHCPKCGREIGTLTSEQIVERVLALGEGTRAILCAPIEQAGSESWKAVLERCQAQGYARVRIDGVVHETAAAPAIDQRRRHDVELVVDRVVIRKSERGRIADSIEHALALGRGVLSVVVASEAGTAEAVTRYSQHLSCLDCNESFATLTPHHFSFNSRLGWCPRCEGLGAQRGTSAESIFVRPDESMVSGAIAGWEAAAERPLLKAMIVALAGAIGCDPDAPCSKLSPEHRQLLLFGLGERWISASGRNVPAGLRFQWKGFFPAIDEATRMSWQYRSSLESLVTDIPCQSCLGGRLTPYPAAARLGGKTIVDIISRPLADAEKFFKSLALDRRQQKIAGELLHEITSRLRFLLDVGLHYLSLGRAAPTLSGGESQRIRLASQIGSGLTGVLYVLDEPTIGLHPRDNARLIGALKKLRDLGNTLLMVEHDREVIAASDHLIDFGPGAGVGGGQVVADGSPQAVAKIGVSLTGQYLSGKAAIAVPTNRREGRGDQSEIGPALTVRGAREHNLKGITVDFPLGRFVCITGVSGSGKSTLVTDILYPALAARIHRARMTPGAHDEITGLDFVDKVINVDQQPIGNSPSSSAITYCGIFDEVRELFARLPESKVRGYTVNRFSFNRPGGRCEDCEGLGQVCHEMHFLPDVWVPCETCGGARYQKELLEVRYKGKTISEVLTMPVTAALELFQNVPRLRRLLQTLEDVGLGYLSLGQSAPTLSGGEAQRVKLAAELGRPNTGKTVYILDEPTTGLHFDDLRKLLDVLHRLVDLGNTVICIEHNLDVIKTADWLIDLGPEAGEDGGRVVAAAKPEDLAQVGASHTGLLLKSVLKAGPHAVRPRFDPKAARAVEKKLAERAVAVSSDAPAVKMPWQRDGRKWHTSERISRDGKSVEWEGEALAFAVDLIERAGKGNLQPTDWNDRARVEIVAKAPSGVPQSAVPWLLHALTGGRWLLDLLFRAPAGSFKERSLSADLRLKTLDERDDIHAYGQTSRVQVRDAQHGLEQVRILVHDKKEIATSAFRDFIARAVKANLDHIRSLARDESAVQPWKADGKAWHLSQAQIPLTQPKRWKPMDLLAFVGAVKKVLPKAVLDWSGQVFVKVEREDGRRIAKIVTHQGEALRVDVTVAPGTFTPTQVEGLGTRQELARKGSSDSGLSFWFTKMSEVDSGLLRTVLQRAAE